MLCPVPQLSSCDENSRLETAEQELNLTAVDCGGAADWPKSTKVLLGKHAVATAAGEHHKLLRKILRPPFSVTAVNDLMPRMADIARRCCDRWAAQGRGKGLMFAKDYTFTVISMSLMHLASLTLHTASTAGHCLIPDVSSMLCLVGK